MTLTSPELPDRRRAQPRGRRAQAVPGQRFASPFAVKTPAGAEDWQRLYPYYSLFSEARREFEESKFWFFDGMHNPEPIYPFDTIMTESWWVALNQYTTRVWVIPPALGIDQRLVNGYLYISPNTITDEKIVKERVAYFTKRAGYYYDNWDRLYEQWIEKAEDCIQRLKDIPIRDLPEVEDEDFVIQGRGLMSGYDLLTSYSRLIENMHEMAYYHFEMLNLGYAAYLTFLEFCRRAFPGILDQTVSKMVVGIDILFFRPDDEIRNLARLAIDLGLADVIKKGGPPSETLGQIADSPNGRPWLTALEDAKDPWFWYSTGSGYNHQHRSWMDDMRLPFNAMRGYIERLEAGEDIERPLREVTEERDRIIAEYRELVRSEEDRAAFDHLVEPGAEGLPVRGEPQLLRRALAPLDLLEPSAGARSDSSCGTASWMTRKTFSTSTDTRSIRRSMTSRRAGRSARQARGPSYWVPEVAARKAIMEKLRAWAPPPALGTPPETITEPFTIMLFGITTEAVQTWLGSQDGDGDGRQSQAWPPRGASSKGSPA